MYANREKIVQLLVFWDRSRDGRHLINYRHCLQSLSNRLKWWNKGKYFTLNSLSNHFSSVENENYHRLVISLQANNLTSLFPCAMDAILLIIDIVYRVCRTVIKSVQQCTYFLFFMNFELLPSLTDYAN
jgi:hypothetical protein